MTTLADIRDKVRKLTKRPVATQITDVSIDKYINTFILYDFPQEVQTFDLTQNIEFCTTPYVDKYSTTVGAYIYNLQDFKNMTVSLNNPVYVAGRQVFLSQDQTEFYNLYSPDKDLGIIGTGDGIVTNFTYTLQPKVLHSSVVIGTLNAAGEALIAVDVPNTDTYGREANTGELRDQSEVAIGTIDYITGAIDVTFGVAPKAGASVTYEAKSFMEDLPRSVLFFNNEFILRPVPDKVYEVKFQVEVLPTELINVGDSPDIKQWFQFIAYGAAIKILQDNSDFETVQHLMPEFINQKMLVSRRTSRIKSKEESKTIYNSSFYPYTYSPWL